MYAIRRREAEVMEKVGSTSQHSPSRCSYAQLFNDAELSGKDIAIEMML
jgi:hypothetical protein